MRYATKAATELTRGDRVVLPSGREVVIMDRRGIVSRHSPGRIGYLGRADDGRCYRLSMDDTERVEVVD